MCASGQRMKMQHLVLTCRPLGQAHLDSSSRLQHTGCLWQGLLMQPWPLLVALMASSLPAALSS